VTSDSPRSVYSVLRAELDKLAATLSRGSTRRIMVTRRWERCLSTCPGTRAAPGDIAQ
jgi:hypothetical protein